MLRAEPWSKQDVVAKLLLSARGPRARLEIVRYFASRSKRFARFAHGRPSVVTLRELAAPLQCSADSGGLAVYYEIVNRRVYTPSAAWVPSPGDLVVDAGANIGVFTLWAAGKVGRTGRVIGFEPNPLAFQVLEVNSTGLPQVSLNELACGAEANRLTLRYPPGRLSISSFEERADRTATAEVDVVPLDDALADVPGDIALLKVDVEGFEAPVLRGATQTMRRTRRMALEIAGTRLEECEKIAAESGLVRVGTLDGMWNLPARLGVVAYFERAGS